MVKIYVDADACPVKNEIERIATRHNLVTYMVCNGGIRPSRNPLVKLVIVNNTMDAADEWIIDHIEKTDICVTNDTPLAEQCLKKGALAIKANGAKFTDDNIGIAIATREMMGKIRELGEVTSGPPPFSKEDRSKFLNYMETIVRSAKKQRNRKAPS